jgi:hypothetical protein
MEDRFQFRIADVLRLTVWIAIACFVARFAFTDSGLRPQDFMRFAAALALLLAPFAAVGALFDRIGLGILCGLAVVAAFILLHLGAR